jgi:hypothetical protein
MDCYLPMDDVTAGGSRKGRAIIAIMGWHANLCSTHNDMHELVGGGKLRSK